MTIPSFVCIGAQKAGTTWLYAVLAQNPGVWLPPVKEVHYFDGRTNDAEHKERRFQQFIKMSKDNHRKTDEKGSPGKNKSAFVGSLASDDILTEAWYRRIFDHPDAQGRISGEMTPAYLAMDRTDVEYAAGLLENSKIIVMVREPAARAVSQLKMALARSEREIVDEAGWNHLIRHIVRQGRGDYKRGIPLWQEYFGDRLKAFPFGDIKTRPGELIGEIEDFLGVPRFNGYSSLTETVHKTKTIEVPDWVGPKFSEIYADQRTYLAEAFGEDFLKRTA